MRLPKYLPQSLEPLRESANTKAFLLSLSPLIRKVDFLESALQDLDFCLEEEALLQEVIATLSRDYMNERMDRALAKRTEKLLHETKVSLPKDLTLQIKNEKIQVTGLLFGTASDYFHSRLRSLLLKKTALITLETSDLASAKALLELLQEGPKHLWRFSNDELIQLIKLAKTWSCIELTQSLEDFLSERILKEAHFQEQQLSWIKTAFELKMEHLQLKLLERWNEQEQGFSFIKTPVGMAVHLNNLQSRTLETLKTCVTFIRGIKLDQEQTGNPNLAEALSFLPKLLWLDLSDTLSNPILSLFPSTITHLILDRTEWLDDSTFSAILEQFRGLEALSLQEASHLTFLSFSRIGKLSLSSLDLTNVRHFGDKELLIVAKGFSRLESLSLSGLKQCMPRAFVEAISYAHQLHLLNLSKTQADDTLLPILDTLPHLSNLQCDATSLSADRIQRWRN